MAFMMFFGLAGLWAIISHSLIDGNVSNLIEEATKIGIFVPLSLGVGELTADKLSLTASSPTTIVGLPLHHIIKGW